MRLAITLNAATQAGVSDGSMALDDYYLDNRKSPESSNVVGRPLVVGARSKLGQASAHARKIGKLLLGNSNF